MAKKRAQSGAKPSSAASPRASGRRPRARPSAASDSSTRYVPPQRSTYVDAIALYERGLEALQKHDYQGAVTSFESVLETFPEERELAERARLYLSVCLRHVAPKQDSPATIEERLYAATLALNSGETAEALRHLRLIRDEDPDNSNALYMLAVAHAQRGEQLEAVAHLSRAIALDPENRKLARRDADLDPLRSNEAFQAAVGSPSGRTERKRSARTGTER